MITDREVFIRIIDEAIEYLKGPEGKEDPFICNALRFNRVALQEPCSRGLIVDLLKKLGTIPHTETFGVWKSARIGDETIVLGGGGDDSMKSIQEYLPNRVKVLEYLKTLIIKNYETVYGNQ